ncbi:DUF1501 domain-containing protein [Gemmata sp. G18]|uniref:DUF1501 domain-containing protein n=1 Tax=Gemmata palustris TaxID=2822762 RepID=A0ABS5BL00_9BACT|nr:DUF1501 domain-containing protein [Gemmata palustris]MBP3953975.1 DUF1501 domain-containing protein [Gemmata palustris]
MNTHFPLASSRREFLLRSGGGLGGIALNWLLQQEARGTDGPRAGGNPLAEKKPHFPASAKRVVFMFMVGGPSQMDLFDPKPALAKWAGKPLPESTGRPKSQFTTGKEVILPSTRKFAKRGKSGTEISDLMPHLATCADDICFLRSCWCSNTVHAPAMYELHSGRTLMGWPSLGSWVTYGLGSVSENLPAYCVMPQPEGVPEGGAPCWSGAFLPPVYQGTLLRRGPNPIINLKPPTDTSAEQNRRAFDLVQKLNAAQSIGDPELEARASSYELAFKMQKEAPDAVDLAKETEATKNAYGLNNKATADFGTRLLLTRRLLERGVRFVTVYSGGGPVVVQWDAHDDINANHEKMCGHTDQPIAAFLKDLKQRGMLKDTLVVWCSEFGRTPNSQGGKGRDHNPLGYTMWLAGGGAKGGTVVGSTDEFGLKTEDDPISVNDFHATILHLLGLDHEKLTFRHSGRDERLTDVGGTVIDKAVE